MELTELLKIKKGEFVPDIEQVTLDKYLSGDNPEEIFEKAKKIETLKASYDDSVYIPIKNNLFILKNSLQKLSDEGYDITLRMDTQTYGREDVIKKIIQDWKKNKRIILAFHKQCRKDDSEKKDDMPIYHAVEGSEAIILNKEIYLMQDFYKAQKGWAFMQMLPSNDEAEFLIKKVFSFPEIEFVESLQNRE